MNEQQEFTSPMIEMTAGEMLKNARTTGRRKREISTIAKLLCIREEFLAALEEGNYRVIPENVYILGFARSYAIELGLDPEEVISKLKKELGIISEEKEEEVEKNIPVKQPVKINKEVIVEWFKKVATFVKNHARWFIAGAVAFCLMLILIIMIVSGGDKKQPESPVVPTENVVQNTVKEPDFRYPVHESFDVKNRKDARVVLQAEKESWVKIEDARGNSVFSRVLIPGDVYYLPSGNNFKATFGNAGAIDVWVDGQLVKKLGPANTKKTGISMSPDALKSVGFAE